MKQGMFLWVSHSNIFLVDLLKNADSSTNKTSEVFMSESLNHYF